MAAELIAQSANLQRITENSIRVTKATLASAYGNSVDIVGRKALK